MNLSAPFILRPVATTLLTLGVLLAGLFAFVRLPVAPLPQIDFPTILVQASMPGASPDTMATTVAAPLERRLGQIADVDQMTSTSSVGQTRIVLQFGLDRDINGAARDVQAAINAARADLPTALRTNPTYRKFNPADAPILILGLTSKTLSPGALYDSAATVLAQKLSQLEGIGNVDIGGSSLPAVRVELDPNALFHYGIGLEGIRAALASANANSPKGAIEAGERRYQLYANDQGRKAADYQDIVVAYRNGAGVRLRDVGQVVDGVEDRRNLGLVNGRRGVLLIVYKQPGGNVVETIDRLKEALPQLKAALPGDTELIVTGDRSLTIRASLAEAERTLIISVGLVILVVFGFLRSARATLIPAVAVPISLVGTFAAMWLCDYSLDNISLMALIIAAGFVVDDAIVVLENIQRHIEDGRSRVEAALLGAREVGFTVLSMSLSLIAVFLPILLAGGIIGRFFQEFAVVLSLAILISLVVSLTTTPMMCARFLKPEMHGARPGPVARVLEGAFSGLLSGYRVTLDWALRHGVTVMLVLLGAVVLNVYLYVIVPKGFFPQQDTGQMIGGIQADQRISFQAMSAKLRRATAIVQADPAVESVVGFTGGRGTNSANVFVGLKPLGQRDPISDVMTRLRPKLAAIPGARLYLFPRQDFSMGGRQSFSQYQYTLQGRHQRGTLHLDPEAPGGDAEGPDLHRRDLGPAAGRPGDAPRHRPADRLPLRPDPGPDRQHPLRRLRPAPGLDDLQPAEPVPRRDGDRAALPRQPRDAEDDLRLDLGRAGPRLGHHQRGRRTVASAATASTDATSAAAVATDSARNAATNAIASSGRSSASSSAAVSSAKETMVPLSAFASFDTGSTPVQVSHQGLFVATTLSFNLAPGKSLSDATAAIDAHMRDLRMPATIHGEFAGAAKSFQSSSSRQPLLILAALLAVYAVLGILYESWVHPLTILSTLPSAGIGAILALMLAGEEFGVIALIAVILLIGIVKKNAIMMIDFALDAERTRSLSPRESIREACLLRFRPIMMTTLAALLGALPLILDGGEGSELRRPLGIAIVGGLIVSQILTLYTTPVVYLYLDRFRLWVGRRRGSATRALPAE